MNWRDPNNWETYLDAKRHRNYRHYKKYYLVGEWEYEDNLDLNTLDQDKLFCLYVEAFIEANENPESQPKCFARLLVVDNCAIYRDGKAFVVPTDIILSEWAEELFEGEIINLEQALAAFGKILRTM